MSYWDKPVTEGGLLAYAVGGPLVFAVLRVMWHWLRNAR